MGGVLKVHSANRALSFRSRVVDLRDGPVPAGLHEFLTAKDPGQEASAVPDRHSLESSQALEWRFFDGESAHSGGPVTHDSKSTMSFPHST